MRIKIFSIPVIGGDQIAAEMNAFLSSKKVLEVEKQLVSQGRNAFWSFCITYIEGGLVPQAGKVDYKEVLDEASCQRRALPLIAFTQHANAKAFRACLGVVI